MQRRHLIQAMAASAGLSTLGQGARAQAAFPTRPVTIVVPFGPGGATDLTARLVAEKLGARWGQPVVVDNKPGAGGNVGSALVAKAAPDGYTIFLATVAHTMAGARYGGYAGEHQATISRDGSRILFATNFDDGGPPSSYLVLLPSWVYR